jgi:hypothetical protein
MRRSGGPIAFLTIAALVAPALRAQTATDLAAVCKTVGDAKLGQWASFDATGISYTETGPTEAGTLRLAAVGSERSGDSTLYWFEVRFSGKDLSHSGVIQLLTPSLAAGIATPRAFIVKAGLQPAVKIPGQMASMIGKNGGENASALDLASRCSGGHVVGWESVTVPAGTFRSLHLTFDSDAEVWASSEVPFGLIKTRRKGGGMVLTGHGTDAKSSITEKPLDMGGMMTKP